MSDGVAQELADDENRVPDSRIEYPGIAQVGGKLLAGDRYACRCPGQQYRPRRSHLPRPQPEARQTDKDPLRRRCPASRQ